MSDKDKIQSLQRDLKKCNGRIDKIEGEVSELSGRDNPVFFKESRDTVYLQLHEQYAINNNANLSTIMALVIALIAVIGYYGFVFINTTSEFIDNSYDLYDPSKGMYSIKALMLIYLASISILTILVCLCTYQGIAQRKEQFIIHAIRVKRFSANSDILPNNYIPYLKKGLEIIQGLYGELVKVFFWVGGALFLAMIIRIIFLYFENKDKINAEAKLQPIEIKTILVLVGLVLVVTLVLWLIWLGYYHKQYKSYISRQIEYSKKLSDVKIKDKPLDYLLTIVKNGDEYTGDIPNIENATCKIRKYKKVVKERRAREKKEEQKTTK